MINAIHSVLSGLNLASQKVAGAANNIADPAKQDGLARDIVDLKLGELSYKANVKALEVVEETSEELLRIFDEEV